MSLDMFPDDFIKYLIETTGRGIMYEAHITINREDYDRAKPIAADFRFHMSNITDDIVMGSGPKAYCTKNSKDLESLIAETRHLKSLLEEKMPVFRWKIEAILIDERRKFTDEELMAK